MLTRSGLGVAVVAVTLLVCGWWWRYDELVAVALALVAALAIAVWSARTAVRTTIERTIAAPRVARGDPIRASYRIANPTRRRSAPMSLVETLTPVAPDDSDHPDRATLRSVPGNTVKSVPHINTATATNTVTVPGTATSTNTVPGTATGTATSTMPGTMPGTATNTVTNTVTNTGTATTTSTSANTNTNTVSVTIELPAVPGNEHVERHGLVPTRRRGTFALGPWSVERVDPLGLAVGRRVDDRTSPILVHPRVHQLRGPYGAMHTVEDEAVIRRAASDPMSGFVSLREYVDGDDPRLIHWPTSARTGTLMVREHVELRRPEFTVVVDCAEQVATPDDFEEMVDVTASVAVHALRSGVNVTLKTTSRYHPGGRRPVEREPRILDVLTPVEQVDDDHHMSLVEIFHAGIDHTMIVFVTGPDGPSTTLVHTDRIATVRVGQGATLGRGVVLAVDDATTFAERWRSWP